MKYGKPCGIFGYDNNEGMKVFCIAEMFLALLNLTIALGRIPVIQNFASGFYKPEGDGYKYIGEIFWVLLIFIFMITLSVQSILAFLLYFLGWKKKNRMTCLLWIIFAVMNMIWPWVLFVLSLVKCQGFGSGWDFYLLYLLYPIYGVWIVLTFMKEEIGTGQVNPEGSKSNKKKQVVVDDEDEAE